MSIDPERRHARIIVEVTELDSHPRQFVLAIMLDGTHTLTPTGVVAALREATQAAENRAAEGDAW